MKEAIIAFAGRAVIIPNIVSVSLNGNEITMEMTSGTVLKETTDYPISRHKEILVKISEFYA